MFDYDTSFPDFQQFVDKEWQSYLTDFDVKLGVSMPTIVSPKLKQISDYFKEWDEKLHWDFDRINTINKLKRSIRLFKNPVGNLVLDQIEPHHAYDFADAQLADNPDVALKTLQNYNWGCQEYSKYYVERGIVTKKNPFGSINLGRRGKRPKNWQPFTRDELYEVEFRAVPFWKCVLIDSCPPLECWRGTKPSQAAKSRPRAKFSSGGANA